MTARLAGRTALVTGGAGGIGLAIASRLAADGARVAVADRNADRLAVALQQLPDTAVSVLADISSQDGVERMIAEGADRLGHIDALVNSAAIAEPIVRTLDQKLADWELVMDVNLRGTLLACRAFASRLLSLGRSGAIVNIGSVAGLGGIPGSNGYGVSKAAVAHLSMNLACEWTAKGIRVNCVAPGYIDAPMAAEMFADGRVKRAAIEQRIPARRLGTAPEVAAVVAFLISDEASYVSGAVIPVDGGWCAYGGP